MYINRPTKIQIDFINGLAKQGFVTPEMILEGAKPIHSPIHNLFKWNDSEAAKKYRLEQAKALIRVCVYYIGEDGKLTDKPSAVVVRKYVALSTERKEGGATPYRKLDLVLKEKNKSEQMFEDAMDELEKFLNKYHNLDVFSGVIKAIKEVKEKYGRNK